MPPTLHAPVLRLVRWAAVPRVLIGLLVLFLVYLWVIRWSPLPFSDAGIADVNGGRGTLDLYLGYSPDQGRELLAALGPEGHRRYDLFQVLDLVFPLVYGLAEAGVLYALWARRGWAVLSAVPLLQAAVDYAENVGVRLALQSSRAGDGLLRLTGALTQTKNVLMYVSLGLVAVGLVLAALSSRTSRRADAEASP